MTALITLSLAALLLIAAWLLGQFPTAAKRMAVTFALSMGGYAVVRLAEQQGMSGAMQTGLIVAMLAGAAVVAWWLIQPWLWGIDDYLAELQAQAEEESEQP